MKLPTQEILNYCPILKKSDSSLRKGMAWGQGQGYLHSLPICWVARSHLAAGECEPGQAAGLQLFHTGSLPPQTEPAAQAN